ncbi:unnamed protein product [Rotaria sp. Silwood1]|nr:unnamed protein product [Rotaria sp. Silwood1]CAF3355610.1 unnamed protein product [Rotaria sp. Silwood1]CAF3382804.1 unnamed protein product [Rotaria sp. Silwood1]CAF4548700.1 unnamed protein product [Rotaria sp. Silwood1]CAF4692264.1 unnamed protein product [Rotaria sp. Silwood1]
MQLIASHVIYRHGDRTPVTTFPTDPVKPSDWPNGLGQLTIAGIEQQHRLGGYLRNRYESLLSTNYTPSEVVVRSTDVDRTLMSAQSNLVGLYPIHNITNDKVPIQPIPIHTVSIHLDFLLGQNDCPRYDQLEDEVDQSDEVKKMNEYYAPFFKKLEEWTNMTNITVYNAWDIADTIFVEHIYNKAPAWADEAVRQNLSDINDLAFHFLYENNDTKRIRGGPLVQDIWLNMNDSVHGKSFHKVKMYSAHDTTVSPVLSFLGINYPHQPQYASAIFIDLYQQNSTYFVKVEYLNVTDSNTSYPYLLNGCQAYNCPFDNFTSIYQPRFPATADIECAKKNPPMPPSTDGNKKLITVLAIVIVAVVIIIFVMFLCLQLRKTNRDPPLLGIDRSLQTV